MCACYKIVIIINYIVRGLFPYFSNLRECQSSYQAKGVCHLCKRYSRNRHSLYMVCPQKRAPKNDKVIKYRLFYFSSLLAVRKWTTEAGYGLADVLRTLLWFYEPVIKKCNSVTISVINSKEELFYTHKSHMSIWTEFSRTWSEYWVLQQYSDNGHYSIFWSFRGLIPTAD